MIKADNIRKNAFTLVEILVVLTIIAILLGIVMIALGDARQDARDTKRRADLEIIRSGLELYKSDCGEYPATFDLGTPGTQLIGPAGITGCTGNIYISSSPADPIDIQNYRYNQLTDFTYAMCALVENPPDPAHDVTNCGGVCSDDGGGTTLPCNYLVTNP